MLEHVSSSDSLVSRESFAFRVQSSQFDDEAGGENSARAAEENARASLKALDALLGQQIEGLTVAGTAFKEKTGCSLEQASVEQCQNFVRSQYDGDYSEHERVDDAEPSFYEHLQL